MFGCGSDENYCHRRCRRSNDGDNPLPVLMSNNDKNVEGSGNIKGLSGVTGCQHGCRDFVTCPCRIKRSSKKCYKVDPYACTEGSNKCSSGVTGFQGD